MARKGEAGKKKMKASGPLIVWECETADAHSLKKRLKTLGFRQ